MADPFSSTSPPINSSQSPVHLLRPPPPLPHSTIPFPPEEHASAPPRESFINTTGRARAEWGVTPAHCLECAQSLTLQKGQIHAQALPSDRSSTIATSGSYVKEEETVMVTEEAERGFVPAASSQRASSYAEGGSFSGRAPAFVVSGGATHSKEELAMAVSGELGASSLASNPLPFVTKTYDMVEDPCCNDIVSWAPANNSFIVWDCHALSLELLPRFFKHNNFSSFIRQLNIYGFRKVDPKRWEFANEYFLRNQKHLLKGIQRRKSMPTIQQKVWSSAGAPCLEVGKHGRLQGEIDILKRDKYLLMYELVRLHQQEISAQQEISVLTQRIHDSEQKQQQLMSFVAKAMQKPSSVVQLTQKSEQTKQLVSISRSCPLPGAGWSGVQEAVEATSSSNVVEEDDSHANVNEELQAFFHEMAQEPFSEDAIGHESPKVQIEWEQSLLDRSLQQSGTKNSASQDVAKTEAPYGLEDISGSFYSVNAAFWQNTEAGEQISCNDSSSKMNLPLSASALESELGLFNIKLGGEAEMDLSS